MQNPYAKPIKEGSSNKKQKTAKAIKEANAPRRETLLSAASTIPKGTPRANEAHTTEDAEEDAGGRNRKPNAAKSSFEGTSSNHAPLCDTVITPEKARSPAASRDDFATPAPRHMEPPSPPKLSRVASHDEEFSSDLCLDNILNRCSFEGMSSPDCVQRILNSPIMDAHASCSPCAFLDVRGNRAVIEAWHS